MTDFDDYLATCQHRVESALTLWLPPESAPPERLHEAMRYSVLAPGKRVRPVLVYAAGRAVGTPPEQLDGLACAVEMIHVYSLIHDDLPAMDDDDLRRGRPTCHRRYDEATAILAGDALQPLAFEIICRDRDLQVPAEDRLAMVETLALASGSRGMAGGQAMDLAATGQPLALAELKRLHAHKTGALIGASVKLGVLAAHNVADRVRDAIDRYATCLGLAFQIRDDVLDVSGSSETLGKTQGKDAAQEKTTYATLLGLTGALRKADSLRQEALSALSDLGPDGDPLRQLADYFVVRMS